MVLVAVALVVLLWVNTGTWYRGRSLPTWLDALNRNPEDPVALQAVRRTAPNALPELVEWLDPPDSRIEGIVSRFPPDRIRAVLIASRIDWQTRAVTAFRGLGAAAEPATPLLVPLLNHPQQEIQMLAATALAEIGPGADEAIPALLAALDDQLAVDPLTNPFGFDSDKARALAVIGLEREEVVQALVQRLHAPPPASPATAKSAPPATPALMMTRYGVTSAEGGSFNADQDWMTTARLAPVLLVLSYANAAHRNAVPMLLPELRHPQAFVRSQIAGVLGGIGPGASSAVPLLLEILEGDDFVLRLAAADALCQIAVDDPVVYARALDVWIRLLRIPIHSIRMRVVQRLAREGPGARRAVPALLKILRSGPTTAEQEFEHLVQRRPVPPAPPRWPPQVTLEPDWRDRKQQVLVRQHSELQGEVAHAVVRVDAWNPEVLEALTRALADEDADLRAACVSALIELIPNQPEVVSSLIPVLSDPRYSLRLQVLTALRRLGPAAAPFASAVRPLLNSTNELVRREARRALAEIEPAAEMPENAR